MRQYISQEDMEATLEKLNSQMDQELHREEVERIKRINLKKYINMDMKMLLKLLKNK